MAQHSSYWITVIHQYVFDPTTGNAISVFALGEQWGHDREALFAEPTSFDISWGKELKDFSMEKTWNFITPTTVMRESFGRIHIMLALPKDRDKGYGESWWSPCSLCRQEGLFQAQCGGGGSCSRKAGLVNLPRQFFYQVDEKQLKPLFLGETGDLSEVGLQRGCSLTPAGAVVFFLKPHPCPMSMLLWLQGMQGSCLTSLSMIWMRGMSAPSVSLQMTPSWVGVSICLRVGRLCRVIWTGWIDGPRPTVWGLARPSAGPALRSKQPHAMLQAWGRVSGKLPSRKGSWGAGRQPAEHEPVVCPGGQEDQRHPGLYQE